MKKTLAIVLALVMVLCMIPAMSADTTTNKTVSDKNYTLIVKSVGTQVGDVAKEKQANSITYNYNFEKEDADVTGKFTEDTKMAYVTVKGLDADLVHDVTVTIDGKKLDSSIPGTGFSAGEVSFPVELTKAGYSDTYLVQITGKNNDKTVTVTETAKVSVKLVNTAAYKGAKTATIADIQSSNKKVLDAYMVGDKIYLDWASDAKAHNSWAGETIEITFKDENGKLFSNITYAYDPNAYLMTKNGVATTFKGEAARGVKLDKSKAIFNIRTGIDGQKAKFELETASDIYATKKVTFVVRSNVEKADPKGLYFAESTKTIAISEVYEPVVMGVATGKRVAVDKLNYGTNTSKEVIDIDGTKIVGTREGVAYITAEYTPFGGTTYTSSSMKIVVTVGPSVPPIDTTTTYYVTCRNLNVRKGPGTSYGKKGMIHRGDAVKVVEIKNGWAKLENGTYVASKYIAK